jgi:hypothetical protein
MPLCVGDVPYFISTVFSLSPVTSEVQGANHGFSIHFKLLPVSRHQLLFGKILFGKKSLLAPTLHSCRIL